MYLIIEIIETTKYLYEIDLLSSTIVFDKSYNDYLFVIVSISIYVLKFIFEQHLL